MSGGLLSGGGSEEGEIARKLILFVAEGEAHSLVARNNLQKILDAPSGSRFTLQIVNVLEDYQTALQHKVLVTPCLLQLEPPPRVMIVGTLQDVERIRIVLRLNVKETEDV